MYEQNNDPGQAVETSGSPSNLAETTANPEVTPSTSPSEAPVAPTNFGSKVSGMALPPLTREEMADEIALENQTQPSKRRSFWKNFLGKGD